MEHPTSHPYRRAVRAGPALFVTLALGGCDFTVANPGPVQDENLSDPGAHASLVTGAMRATLGGMSDFSLTGGAISRDFHAGGHTGWAGVEEKREIGQLSDEWTEDGGWDDVHKGRWIAEHAVEVFTGAMGQQADAYAPLARAYLWAGFANRILGEHVCTAVFDGGSTEPYLAHFTRAVEQFTQAEKIARAAGDESTALAALAGRAQARVFLGGWDEAAADAAGVPVDFAFQVRYTGRNTDEHSWVLEAATLAFKSVTFWYTPFEEYFLVTGDPRVAWGHDENIGADVPRPTWGRVIPMYYPLKTYAPRRADELTVFAPVEQAQHEIPQDMADGREMVLIRAEARLAKGDWRGAMVLINEIRTTAADRVTGKLGSYFTGEPLEPVQATSLEEAWAALKFERLVELNLEARRFGDRKRWKAAGTPGEIHPLEYVPDNHVQKYGVPKDPDLCFPIPRTEKERNRNIPLDFRDIGPDGKPVW